MRAFWGSICSIFCFVTCSVFAQEWVQQITGAYSVITSIAGDRQNNCFISGLVFGTQGEAANFGMTRIPAGPFFARYTRNGQLAYVQQTEGTRMLVMVGSKLIALEGLQVIEIHDNGRKSLKVELEGPDLIPTAMSACDANSFVLSGYFSTELTIGKQTFLASTTNGPTQFVARLGTSGKVMWFRELGTIPVLELAGTARGGAYALTLDRFWDNPPSGAGYRDVIAVTALGKKGQILWRSEMLGTYQALPGAIAVDADGRCLIVGGFYGIIEAGTTTLANWTSRAAYFYGFTPDGTPDFAMKLPSYSNGKDIAFDREGNWYAGIDYSGSDGFNGAVLQNGSTFFGRIDFTSTENDVIHKMAIGRDGDLYVAGQTGGTPAAVGTTVLTNSGTFISKFRLP